MRHLIRWTLALATITSVPSLATAIDADSLSVALSSITADDLKRHIDFLASDTLEGREAGSQGGFAAAAYLVDRLRTAGLKAASNDGDYYQFFSPNFRNIVAVLPGSDDKLKTEYVLIGAHYDHVGYGAPHNSRGPIGVVHNGADDNASGTSGLLEIVQALKTLKSAPRRSILIAFWDGEEKGLLGSRYYTSFPLIALDRIRFHLNLDMIGRLRPDSFEVSGWRSAPGLRNFLTNQNLDRLTLDFTLANRADSDHWPFFERHVPSVMFHTGKHDDYHRPSDDPPAINSQGTEQITRYALRVILAAADAESLPAFRPDALHESGPLEEASARIAASQRTPSRLGVGFDLKLSEQHIVKVTRIEPGSPAALAGIQKDDQILEFGGRTVADAPDFKMLVASTSNDTSAKIKRGEETLSIPLKLRGEPAVHGLLWQFNEAEPEVAVVTGVVPGSAAERAGLKVGDRIRRLADKNNMDSGAFRRMLIERQGPEPLTLEAEWQGIVRQLDLKPEASAIIQDAMP